jgi:two-component system chemotaxis response regulator CheB
MIESPVPIVVLSSLFSDGSVTFEALRLGVVDFIPKPSGAVSRDIANGRQQIADRLKMAHAVNMDNIRRVRLLDWNAKERLCERYGYQPLDHLIALGTSLGGPNTIIRLFSILSPNLPAAALVVQEISPKILPTFVKRFDEHVPWKVAAAGDDVVIEQGTCYIGSSENAIRVQVNQKGEPCLKVDGRASQRPLDLLFSSSAHVFSRNAVGVLLSGIGDDGADGFSRIQAKSGVTIAQHTDTCVYPNLTRNAIERRTVDIVADESRLPAEIEAAIQHREIGTANLRQKGISYEGHLPEM